MAAPVPRLSIAPGPRPTSGVAPSAHSVQWPALNHMTTTIAVLDEALPEQIKTNPNEMAGVVKYEGLSI
jgi:hypothetical protein